MLRYSLRKQLGAGAGCLCMFIPQERWYKDLAAERGTFGLTPVPGKPDTTELDMKEKLLSQGLGRRLMDPKVRVWLLMDRGLCCFVGSHRSDLWNGCRRGKASPELAVVHLRPQVG